MALYLENITTPWWKSLNHHHRQKIMDDRLTHAEVRRLSYRKVTPMQWWDGLNWVQKSEVYTRFLNVYMQPSKVTSRSSNKKKRGENK